MTDQLPFPPRQSFPPDACADARDAFFVSSREIEQYLESSRLEDEEKVSCEEYARSQGEWAVKEYEESGLLPQPELTDLGWLNLTELEANLAQRGIELRGLLPPTRALLAAMTELAATYGRDAVRLVYWIGL